MSKSDMEVCTVRGCGMVTATGCGFGNTPKSCPIRADMEVADQVDDMVGSVDQDADEEVDPEEIGWYGATCE
jgi:hypothetical protein